MASILVIDDDAILCDMLIRRIRGMGHEATAASSLQKGLDELRAGQFDVTILDVCLPDGNGLAALPVIREVASPPEVIIVTGDGDPSGAELAIKNGAWDYIHKPISSNELTLQLTRVLKYREEKTANRPAMALNLGNIAGKSPSMRGCFDLLAQAAGSHVNVLITGETGTGKELFARAIHENSPRAGENFVVVDCAALPANLVESVLFGHVKGAFTGADKTQSGLVEQADKGTLFLDEIGELPLAVQRAFLRVLQERCFRPVGGNREIRSAFRLVSATNRDLNEEVKAGRFRSDLLFRLQTISIELPPLRKRSDDIKYIVLSYLDRLCESHQADTRRFSPDFFEALESYSWPGNVRELLNAVDWALANAGQESTLFARHLPLYLRIQKACDSLPATSAPQDRPDVRPNGLASLPSFHAFRSGAVDAAERQYLQKLLSATKGNVKEACELSELSKSRLYELLKKHHLSGTE